MEIDRLAKALYHPMDQNQAQDVRGGILRRVVARLQAIEEELPLAQEVGPSDIVGLLHFIAEADKRLADRLGIQRRRAEELHEARPEVRCADRRLHSPPIVSRISWRA